MANIGLHIGADWMAGRECFWLSRISVGLMSIRLMPTLTDQHVGQQKISLAWDIFGG